MGGSFSRLMSWLAGGAFAGSFLATLYRKNVLTVDQFLYALFMFWLLFFGGYSLLFALFREGRKRRTLSLRGSVRFAPALQVKKVRGKRGFPPLLLPEPMEKMEKEEKRESRGKEMPRKRKAATESIGELQEREPQVIAQIMRHTWLTS